MYSCRGNFEAATVYNVEVTQGVSTEGGAVLEKGRSLRLATGDRSSSVSFATSGPYLPAGRGFKIPVKVVNHKELEVELMRIFPNNLLQFKRESWYKAANSGVTVFKKKLENGARRRISVSRSTLTLKTNSKGKPELPC